VARKISRELAALSAGVIVTVYAAGYAISQPAASVAQIASRAATVHAPVGGYRDGVYTGSGESPYGRVTVALRIAGSRITAVTITDCTTYFPQSWIDGLPAQVVARQGPRIDLVSGATGSSTAFEGAVVAALAQAGAVGGRGT
jgi:uncharacterized protein with FMN-binding domain